MRAPKREHRLRAMNWSNEPATESQLGRLRQFGYSADCPLTKGEAAYLINQFEQVPRTEAAGGSEGAAEIGRHVAYALRLAIEHTRRAMAESGAEQTERLHRSLEAAIAKRLEFWRDSCRNPARMQCRSAPVLDLYRKHGCRFVAPTYEQVLGVIDALDAASPIWDRDNPALFYQTLELNFPELVRHF